MGNQIRALTHNRRYLSIIYHEAYYESFLDDASEHSLLYEEELRAVQSSLQFEELEARNNMCTLEALALCLTERVNSVNTNEKT
jgi:hypothetical protein